MSLSVLWLSRTIPLPLNAGDRIYTARSVEALADAGGKITFFGLANPDEPMGSLCRLSHAVDWREVPGKVNKTSRAVLSKLPLVSARFATRAYRMSLRHALSYKLYDAVILDQYAMTWVLPELRRSTMEKSAIIHIAHDFETDVTQEIAKSYRGNVLRKLALTQNAWKTRQSELALARGCDGVVALTSHDAAAFQNLCPRLTTLVLPPGYSGYKCEHRILTDDVPRRVVILGSFYWIAKQMNLESFLRVASPAFKEAQIECCVVGSIPQNVLGRWQAEFSNITFTGFVDDIRPIFASARIGLVVEATGGGFKLKALDYVFGRLPLAGFADGLRGLPQAVLQHTISATEASALVKAVIESIDDLSRLNTMQNQAFDAAKGFFDWSQNGRDLLAFVKRVRQNKLT